MPRVTSLQGGVYRLVFLNRPFGVFMMTLITLNVAAVVTGSVDDFRARWGDILDGFEVFSVVVFSVEYVLKVYACGEEKRYRGLPGRLRYAVTPMAVVDLVSVLPFYLPLLFPFDLRFVRALRLVRVFRMLKMGRYSSALRLFGEVLSERKGELVMVVVLVLVLLPIVSTLMYYAEHDAQAEAFPHIPAALWWGITALGKGQGGVQPVTVWGKVIAGVVFLMSIGTFALPAAILAAGIESRMARRRGGDGKASAEAVLGRLKEAEDLLAAMVKEGRLQDDVARSLSVRLGELRYDLASVSGRPRVKEGTDVSS